MAPIGFLSAGLFELFESFKSVREIPMICAQWMTASTESELDFSTARRLETVSAKTRHSVIHIELKSVENVNKFDPINVFISFSVSTLKANCY